MPEPMTMGAVAASAVSGVGGLITGHYNRKLQRQTNQQNIDQANYTYALQRQHAIEDRDYANKYNDPQQVMARYAQAGLNPHLIYGNGTSAPSAVVRSSERPTPHLTAPQMNAGLPADVVNTFMHALVTMADTAKTQADTALIKTRNIGEGYQNQIAEINLDTTKKVQSDVIKNWALRNKNMETNQSVLLDRNDREAIAQTVNLQKTLQDILTAKIAAAKSREEITNLQAMRNNLLKEAELKDLDINLKKMGIQPNDAWYSRAVAQFISSGNAKSTLEWLNSQIYNFTH